MQLPDRITFRLGALAGPLADHCERTGRTASEAVRVAVAQQLGVAPPEMPVGNPEFRQQGGGRRRKRKKK